MSKVWRENEREVFLERFCLFIQVGFDSKMWAVDWKNGVVVYICSTFYLLFNGQETWSAWLLFILCFWKVLFKYHNRKTYLWMNRITGASSQNFLTLLVLKPSCCKLRDMLPFANQAKQHHKKINAALILSWHANKDGADLEFVRMQLKCHKLTPGAVQNKKKSCNTWLWECSYAVQLPPHNSDTFLGSYATSKKHPLQPPL